MKSLGNFGGILFRKNTPVIEFKYRSGMLQDIKILTDNILLLPTIFRFRNSSEEALTEFLFENTTPDTRIGLNERLSETPLQYYDLERMLRWHHGYLFGQPFWVKQDGDLSCWKYSPLEGVGVKPVECYEDIPYNWELIVTGKEYKRR